MKKTSILFLALLLAASMVACGTKGNANTSSVATSSSAVSSAPEVSSTAKPASQQEESSETAGAPVRGVVNGQVYTSEYLGLTFTAPKSWVFLDDEKIAQTMNVGVEEMGKAGVKFDADALKAQTLYDMMVMDASTGSNVIIAYENLAVNPLGTLITAERYLDVLQGQLSKLQKTGTTMEFGEVTTQKVGSVDFYVMPVTITQNGTQLSQYYYSSKTGDYISAIIVTVMGNDSIDTIMANFS